MMAMKQRDQPPTAADLEKQRLCAACGSSERWFLHYAKYNGAYRKLCTHCILKQHPALFCPICLTYYDPPPPVRDRVMCLRCPSVSHSACVAANSSFHGFQCPPCSHPSSFSFFKLKAPQPQNQNDAVVQNAQTTTPLLVIDKDAAKALVAAARVSSHVMTKAAALARHDADKRVREALSAKKKARDTLERLAFLVSKQQKDKEDKAAGGGRSVVSAPQPPPAPPADLKPKVEGHTTPIQIQPIGAAKTEGTNNSGLRGVGGHPMEED